MDTEKGNINSQELYFKKPKFYQEESYLQGGKRRTCQIFPESKSTVIDLSNIFIVSVDNINI